MSYSAAENKSVGKTKKTSKKAIKKKVNPIIVLMSVLISKKYANYGRCPVTITEEYDEKIMSFLKNLDYSDEDITKMLNSNKELVTNCKNAYKTQNTRIKAIIWSDYVLNPMVDVEACLEIIIQSMPEDFVNAAVSVEALGDVLGVLVNKKKDEIWDYVAGVQRQVVNKTRL